MLYIHTIRHKIIDNQLLWAHKKGEVYTTVVCTVHSCVCACECMRACVCVSIKARVQVYVHGCVHTCINIYMYMYVYLKCTYVVCTCMYVCACTCMRVYALVSMYVYNTSLIIHIFLAHVQYYSYVCHHLFPSPRTCLLRVSIFAH